VKTGLNVSEPFFKSHVKLSNPNGISNDLTRFFDLKMVDLSYTVRSKNSSSRSNGSDFLQSMPLPYVTLQVNEKT